MVNGLHLYIIYYYNYMLLKTYLFHILWSIYLISVFMFRTFKDKLMAKRSPSKSINYGFTGNQNIVVSWNAHACAWQYIILYFKMYFKITTTSFINRIISPFVYWTVKNDHKCYSHKKTLNSRWQGYKGTFSTLNCVCISSCDLFKCQTDKIK